MKLRKCAVLIGALLVGMVMASPVLAADVLFVGNENSIDPTSGDDGFVFDHLLDDLGHAVTYLPSSDATTADGEEADLVVLSSTFGSGTARGKFPDIETPILQWEEALIRTNAGNFNMSDASGNGDDAEFDTIIIQEADHPIVQLAGLEAGEVVVYDDFKRLVWAGGLSPDTVGIAEHADFADLDERWVLSAIEAGGELSDGQLAPGPRVNFFIENTGFANLTEEGLALFDASVAWLLGEEVDAGTQLQAGDANMDLQFDQLDLVQVQVSAKYLTGVAATWGEGDWNGAPGGSVGNPPAGNGLFDQLDVISALSNGLYLKGIYAALTGPVGTGDGNATIVYDVTTGELGVEVPGTELTAVNITSAAGIFTGDPADNLSEGGFDNDTDTNIFKSTFGSSFGSLSFGNVAQTGLSEEFVTADLTVIGALAGGGGLGAVDLRYIPEPSSLALLALGLVAGLAKRRRRRS